MLHAPGLLMHTPARGPLRSAVDLTKKKEQVRLEEGLQPQWSNEHIKETNKKNKMPSLVDQVYKLLGLQYEENVAIRAGSRRNPAAHHMNNGAAYFMDKSFLDLVCFTQWWLRRRRAGGGHRALTLHSPSPARHLQPVSIPAARAGPPPSQRSRET